MAMAGSWQVMFNMHAAVVPCTVCTHQGPCTPRPHPLLPRHLLPVDVQHSGCCMEDGHTDSTTWRAGEVGFACKKASADIHELERMALLSTVCVGSGKHANVAPKKRGF